MNSVSLLLVLSLSLLFTPASNASDGGKQPPPSTAPPIFSADDFDWREMVPSLSVAAALPGEQGIKEILETSSAFRAYIAREVQLTCRLDRSQCPESGNRLAVDAEVSKSIAAIVQEGLFSRHKSQMVDYQFERQPFPFSEVAVLKSENHQDAYFVLKLADRNYTADQLQAKYGAPYDTSISQWYTVFKYRLDSPRYATRAVFEVDPTDGAVLKIAISVKAKRKH